MWKNEEDRLLALALAVAFHSDRISSKEDLHIKGTFYKRNSDEMISVCVLGTGDYIPVKIDEGKKISLNGKSVEIVDLPVRTYIEADLEEPVDGKSVIKNIKADNGKTVLSFSEINKNDVMKIKKLLENTRGVNNFKLYGSALQVLVGYNHKLVSCQRIEEAISEAGLKLE
jgi:hypothetical protein